MNAEAWCGGLGPAFLALACPLSPLTRYLVMLRGAAPLHLVPHSCTPFFVMDPYHCFCCALPEHPSCFWSCVILDVARYRMLPGAPFQYSSEGSERVRVFFLWWKVLEDGCSDRPGLRPVELPAPHKAPALGSALQLTLTYMPTLLLSTLLGRPSALRRNSRV